MSVVEVVGFVLILTLLGRRRLLTHQRGVILRIGKFHRLVGPGVCWRIPLLEDLILIDLRDRPEWNNLAESEIWQRLRDQYARECDDKARARDLLQMGRMLLAAVLAVGSYFLIVLILCGLIIFALTGRQPDGQVLGLAVWAMAIVVGIVFLARWKLRRVLRT